MASISMLNPKAEIAKAQNAFKINSSAALGLFEVLKTNLGPKGTMKRYVDGFLYLFSVIGLFREREISK